MQRKFHAFGVLAALCLSASCYMRAQTVTVKASQVGGSRPATGTIVFTPVLANGQPATVDLANAGGLTTTQQLTAPVVNGVFILPGVTDTASANPANICYRVTLTTRGQTRAFGAGMDCVQPAANNAWCHAGVCNLDAYTPALGTQALAVTGPKGEPGTTGAPGLPGAPGTVTATGTNGGFSVPGNLITTGAGSSAPAPQSPSNIATLATVEAQGATLQTVSRTVAQTDAKVNFRVSSKGRQYYTAAPSYVSFYPSDATLAETANPDLFPAQVLQDELDIIYGAADANGNWPSAINRDEVAVQFYSPWVGTGGCHPDGDTEWMVPQLEYMLWQKTGSIAHFAAHTAQIERALGNIPLNSATGLVNVSNGCWAPWLFQEVVRFSGDVTTPSIFWYRDAANLAALYTAAGDTTSAARWQAAANKVRASLTTSSPLWDSANGIFLAATGQNAQPDVLGSAFAVYQGVVTGTQAQAIGTWLSAHASTLFYRGFSLQTYKPANQNNWTYTGLYADGPNPTCAGSSTPYTYCKPGVYHNGYWSVGNQWILTALDLANPDAADSYALAQFSDGNDANLEYVNQKYVINGAATPPASPNLESPAGTAAWVNAHYQRFAGAGPTAVELFEPLMNTGYGTGAPTALGPNRVPATNVVVNHSSSEKPLLDAWGSPVPERDNYNPATGENFYWRIDWSSHAWNFMHYDPVANASHKLFGITGDGFVPNAPIGNVGAPTLTSSGTGVTASFAAARPVQNNLFTVNVSTGSTFPAAASSVFTVQFSVPFSAQINDSMPAISVTPNCSASPQYVSNGGSYPLHVIAATPTQVTLYTQSALAPNASYAWAMECKIF